MLNIDKENLRDVFFSYQRYARLMCAEDADSEDIQAAVDDACEAAHACVDIPLEVVESFQNAANKVAVLEQSNPEKALELEDTYLTYLETL